MKTQKIVKGSSIVLSVSLKKPDTCDPCGTPYPLAGLQGATALFFAATGGSLAASGVLVSADRGIINIPLSGVQTGALLEGEEQDFQMNLQISGEPKVVIFNSAIDVIAQIF